MLSKMCCSLWSEMTQNGVTFYRSVCLPFLRESSLMFIGERFQMWPKFRTSLHFGEAWAQSSQLPQGVAKLHLLWILIYYILIYYIFIWYIYIYIYIIDIWYIDIYIEDFPYFESQSWYKRWRTINEMTYRIHEWHLKIIFPVCKEILKFHDFPWKEFWRKMFWLTWSTIIICCRR